MTPRISNAIDIFLDALTNNTLHKGSCYKCAVGNLVREGMLKDPNSQITDLGKGVKIEDIDNADWNKLFVTTPYGREIRAGNEKEIQKALKCISYTDFTEEELSRIEYAFETNADNFSRQGMIRGLNAVVKVMLEFDEQKDEVKEVFTNKAELILVC
jgi:hypothetical protein